MHKLTNRSKDFKKIHLMFSVNYEPNLLSNVSILSNKYIYKKKYEVIIVFPCLHQPLNGTDKKIKLTEYTR